MMTAFTRAALALVVFALSFAARAEGITIDNIIARLVAPLA